MLTDLLDQCVIFRNLNEEARQMLVHETGKTVIFAEGELVMKQHRLSEWNLQSINMYKSYKPIVYSLSDEDS